jgi:signal transduction histidine kinase
MTTVDLADAVAGAAEALQVAYDGVDVVLDVAPTDRPIYVNADPHRIAQIISNLLENALKYAAHGVIVAVTTDARGARITVEDDGPGIDPEDLPHVLERLFTSDRHPARASGTGLGLAIVSELVSAMGGTIGVTSPTRDGGGTRITVDFPTSTAPDEPSTTGQ